MAEIPKSWQLVEISDIAETTSGGTPSRANRNNYCGDIPWIKSGNLNDGIVSEADEFITAQGLKSSAAKVFPPGTILIALYGATIGKLGILSIDASTNQAICGIFLSEHVSRKYLFHFLYFQRRDLIKLGQGGAQPNISQQIVRSIQIPLPPFNEQERIVAKLEELFSELDDGIASLKTARAQLKIYRQALLKHAFEGKLTESWRKAHAAQLESADQLLARIAKERAAHYQKQFKDWKHAVKVWEKGEMKTPKPSKPKTPPEHTAPPNTEKLPEVPRSWCWQHLDEICEIGSGMSVSKERKLIDPITVPYLRVANVQRGSLSLDVIKTLEIERYKLDELRLRDGDILFNEGGDRDKLGRGWVWDGQIDPCITQNHVFRATPYSRMTTLPRFISHWGNTFGQDFFLDNGKQTTNLASINKGVLSNFPIPLPSIEEQTAILEILDDNLSVADSLANGIDTQLQKAEALRQSILKKAFSGQLVAQDPADEPASVLLERIRAGREAGASVPKAKKKTARSRA